MAAIIEVKYFNSFLLRKSLEVKNSYAFNILD